MKHAPTQGKAKHFSLDMTVGEAMAVHPRVREVLATFRLGGCIHCSINRFDTLGQVCAGYGVDGDNLLEALEELLDAGKVSSE